MKKQICHFHSICIPQISEDLEHPADVGSQKRLNLVDQYHSELQKISPRETWSGDAHLKSVPYPILGTEIHQQQLTTLSDALVLAITDIVERWWTDPVARFPERMPIEPVEQELLIVCTTVTQHMSVAFLTELVDASSSAQHTPPI